MTITQPAGLIKGDSTPEIRVAYSDAGSGVNPASLVVEIDGVTLTTGCQAGPSAATCELPTLARGTHTVAARIGDAQGNIASQSLEFNLLLPLDIAFIEPTAELLTAVPAVRVSGTVSTAATSVTVNGVAAQLQSGSFAINSLGLHDGVNDLIAVAEDASGNIGTATIRVVADTTAPTVSVNFPAEGARLASATATVSGLVNDVTIGTVSDTQATVTVNGIAATVENRSYVATGITLQPGPNTLTVVARDRAGNQSTAEVHVTLEQTAGVPSIRLISGDGQTGATGTQLSAPLVVSVKDAAGQPMPSAQVVFSVDQGNGVLTGGSGLLWCRPTTRVSRPRAGLSARDPARAWTAPGQPPSASRAR